MYRIPVEEGVSANGPMRKDQWGLDGERWGGGVERVM